MKKVIILGSTGSIGQNAVRVIRQLKGFRIVGIAAYANHKMLLRQAHDIKPTSVSIVDSKKYSILKKSLSATVVRCGEHGILDMIDTMDADILVCAFATSIGIMGVLRAIEKKMRICLATKEILVSFGEIVMDMVRKHDVELLPVDSEHSAIYQCLEGKRHEDVRMIILTASGGPFLHKPIKNVRKADVLNHPVWKMGAKITVDSATMMNKGLEVIEAHHLFGFPADRIKVVIHPEALCHSCIQFADGTLLAQLSTPDMKLPIQYALTAPQRMPSMVKYLNIENVKHLKFMAPDIKKFPCLSLAYAALRSGRSMPAVLNAANEEAVKLFLDDKLKFNDIPKVIERAMEKHKPVHGSISAYMEAEIWAKHVVRSMV